MSVIEPGAVLAWQSSPARPHGGAAGQQLRSGARAAAAAPRSVSDLCEQFALVGESAVDSLEVCSALEFEGLNDQLVQEGYGLPDVFALAEEVYRQVPRRPAEPDQPPDPWRASKYRPALHGLLYGLPTVCFPAATGLLAGRGSLSVLVVALLASWAISQMLAHLGYERLGQLGLVQARPILRAGLGVGLAGVVLVMAVVSLLVRVHFGALVFGAGLGAYMLGATVLLVLGEDRLLLVALAPGVLGSAVFLVLGRPPQLEHAAWVALAATPLLALALSLTLTIRLSELPSRGRHARRSPPAGKLFATADLPGALPSGGFGLVAAGLLVYPVLSGAHGPGGINAGALLASLPLALSMGAAEWRLIWYRRRMQVVLRSTRQLKAFQNRATLVLFAALLQFLAAAALLTVAVVAVAIGTGLVRTDWTALPQVLAYLALGGAMFLALLLQAFGSRTVPLICCAIALIFEILLRGFGAFGQLVACAELQAVLAGYAAAVLSKTVRHAC